MYEPRQIEHAQVATATPTVHPKHPFKNQESHDKLLRYLQARLRMGKEYRDGQIGRYAQIDRDVAGWMRLSEEDKKRQAEQQETGIPKATAINLPLNFVHLDDMMTYYAEVFAPNRGMFYHTGKPDETDPATQIVTLMNNHAIYSGMYRQVLMTLFGIMKYNLGGLYSRWSQDYGPRIQRDEGGVQQVEDEVIWEGNRVEALDLYNTFWDPTIHPVNLHRDGEWGARAFVRSHFWLASRAALGLYFNCDEALDSDAGLGNVCAYYRSPPREAKLDMDESTGKPNWISILSEAPDYFGTSGFELVEVIIKLNPNDFNLLAQSPRNRNRYEVWRFTILNDKYIIETTHMTNAHGQIPFYFGLANDDMMGTSAKSPAEIIQPLQNFASHLLNVHIAANRKKLWGITFYDPTVVDYSKIPEGEVAAQIPIEASGYGKDISEAIYHDQESLESQQTMRDISVLFDIVNMFFPTQALPMQIGNIDRAIDSQVAAVQQGANRRQHKTAKLLDDSLFRPMRASMYYNIIQFQKDDVEIMDFTGSNKPLRVDLSLLRQTDLPFIIGQGLKAIDRMMISARVQQVIFALLQSQQASEIDILGMIDFWTNMLDIDLNFSQFRRAATPPTEGGAGVPGTAPTEGGAVGPEQAIIPLTNPADITEPLR